MSSALAGFDSTAVCTALVSGQVMARRFPGATDGHYAHGLTIGLLLGLIAGIAVGTLLAAWIENAPPDPDELHQVQHLNTADVTQPE